MSTLDDLSLDALAPIVHAPSSESDVKNDLTDMYAVSYEHAKENAATLGLEIKLPKDNELFIDIDSEEDYATFQKQLSLLVRQEPALIVSNRPSKSGLPKRHIVVALARPVIGELERILLQAALGSDRKRELLSWVRVKSGESEHPTLFFEKPGTPDVATDDAWTEACPF